MLAGCGESPVQNSSTVEETSQTTSQAETSQTTKEKPKINILVPYAPFDVKTDNAVKELSEKTGYQVEFDTLPEQNSNDRLNLIFSSGNIDYDYIRIGSGDVEKSLFVTYASRGLLEDLTEKIPQYSNLEAIDKQGYEALSQEGKIYGIPSTGMPYASATNAIRMDWKR